MFSWLLGAKWKKKTNNKQTEVFHRFQFLIVESDMLDLSLWSCWSPSPPCSRFSISCGCLCCLHKPVPFSSPVCSVSVLCSLTWTSKGLIFFFDTSQCYCFTCLYLGSNFQCSLFHSWTAFLYPEINETIFFSSRLKVNNIWALLEFSM